MYNQNKYILSIQLSTAQSPSKSPEKVPTTTVPVASAMDVSEVLKMAKDLYNVEPISSLSGKCILRKTQSVFIKTNGEFFV